jgi:hypothetical protein
MRLSTTTRAMQPSITEMVMTVARSVKIRERIAPSSSIAPSSRVKPPNTPYVALASASG